MQTKITYKHLVQSPDESGRELDLDDPYDKEEYIIQLTIKAMRGLIEQQNQHNCIIKCPKCGHDLSGYYLCDDSEDEIYGQAVRFVIETKRASSAALQRKFKIGYARAARLIDRMEENGIVGPADGATPRAVPAKSLHDDD